MESKPKILIVDDEEGPRESLKIILKPEFDVTTLARGSEAIELLRDGSFELVLLDITMPEDLSGTDTLQAIRAAEIDVEAIVISGQGAADPIMACVNLGAYRYIKKPYRADDVVSAVRAALAERMTRKRAEAMRERFLGSLSHELRTPLNAIVGYTEILHDEARGALAEEHQHALARIQHSSERLLAYWEGLFFLGELDAGSVLVKPRELVVQPWLEQVVRRIDHSAQGGRAVALDCTPGLVGYTHPDTLARLLSILLYEATEEDDGTARLSARDEAGTLVLTIEYDRMPLDEPFPGEAESADSAVVTELAREVVSRASLLLGASVDCRSNDDGRVRVVVKVPGRVATSSSRAASRTHFAPGALAAAPR
jgi:DNA-binding NarL/FixJ family response regulator